jgi:tetratricopeptide (TPR) repeat protein
LQITGKIESLDTTGNRGSIKNQDRLGKRKLFKRLVAFGLATLVGTACIVSAIVLYMSKNEVVILVADFDGLEVEKYGVTKEILHQLRTATEKYADVKIESLGKTIDEKQGRIFAREEGMKRNAAIVIWGSYTKTAQTIPVYINFEILKKPDSYVSWEWDKIAKDKNNKFNPDTLESFKLQEYLSKKMNYLTLSFLGLSRYSAGDYKGAITIFTDALNQQEKTILNLKQSQPYIPLFYRGISYFRIKDDQNAINDISKIIELSPSDANVYWARGFMNASNSKCNDSIRDFTKSLEINPKNSLTYSIRGAVFAEQGKYNDAIVDLKKAIELNPTESEGYLHLAMIYRISDKIDDAISNLNKAIQTSASDSKSRSMAYVELASLYHDLGDNEKGASSFNEAIKTNSNLDYVYFHRGDYYLSKREYDLSLLDFDQSIKNNPDSLRSRYYRARVNGIKKNFDGAISDYSKAIELESTGIYKYSTWRFSCEKYNNYYFRSAYLERGKIFEIKGDSNRALANYEEALKKVEDNSAKYVNYGVIYTKMNNFASSVVNFTKAIELSPNEPSLYNWRGNAYEEMGKHEKALTDFSQALSTAKKNLTKAYVHDSIGTMYRRSNREDLAIQNYNQAIEMFEKEKNIDSNVAESYFWLGTIYQSQGNIEVAKKYFNKSLNFPENLKFSEMAKNKIREIP